MSNISLKQIILGNKKDLMGLAIILIMCFHGDLGENIKNFRLIYFAKGLCDIGVDIFMLLSGFSLAVSLKHNNNLITFYKKRFFRLLPSYLIVFSIWYAFIIIKDGGGIGLYLYNLFFLNYYIDYELIIWFVPVIFLYYLLIPFYLKLISWCNVLKYLPYIIIIINIYLISNNINPRFTLLRLPIFLIGANMYFTSPNKSNSNLNASLRYFFLLIAAIIGTVCCYYCMFIGEGVRVYKYIAYIPMTIFLVTLYRKAFFSSILCFLGGITFEIYLLHERIQWIFGAIHFKVFPKFPIVIVCIISILVAIFAAYSFNKLIN